MLVGNTRSYTPALSTTYERNGTKIGFFSKSDFVDPGIISLDTFCVSISS